MSAVVLRGKPVVEAIERRIAPEIEELKSRHHAVPTLAVVQVSDDPPSTRYVRRKIESCRMSHTLINRDAAQLGPQGGWAVPPRHCWVYRATRTARPPRDWPRNSSP
jgi:hypothetical protein